MMPARAPLFGDTGASRAAWLARTSLLFYAAVLPFTHNAALKNFALLGMLLAVALTAFERRLKVDLRSPVLLAVAGVAAVALLASVIGDDVGESLDALRKHFLPLLLSYPLLVVYFRRRRAVLLLLAVLTAAFSLRAALSLHDMLTVGREDGLFFKGYGMEATLYMPLLLGIGLAATGRWRYFLGAVLALATAALVMAGTRTGLAAVALGCIAVPLSLKGQRRQALPLLATAAMVVVVMFAAKPQTLQHFGKALNVASYVGPSGMSARYPIWLGVWQVAQRHPVLGHGFGWKKLGRTAVEQGFVARWQAADDPYLQQTAWWFSLPTDKVNPHNLALELLFEIGFVGLAAYVLMLMVLIRLALTLARHGPPEWRIFGAMIVGFFASYLVMNVSNGLWLGAGPSTLLIGLLEICRLASQAEASEAKAASASSTPISATARDGGCSST